MMILARQFSWKIGNPITKLMKIFWFGLQCGKLSLGFSQIENALLASLVLLRMI